MTFTLTTTNRNLDLTKFLVFDQLWHMTMAPKSNWLIHSFKDMDL